MGFVAMAVRRILTFSIGLFYGIMVGFGLLVKFVKTGGKMLYVKKRDEKPACLLDPALGEHKFISLEDIRMHYVVNGDESKPLMLFVHGFPEFWYSWRYQLREFKKDYRVVAIDQRGYSETDAPSGVMNYTIDKMVKDIKQLIPALGYQKCVLVGHDWGGIICWAFTTCHSELVDRLVIMNAPHPGVFRAYVQQNWSQFKKSWYTFLFQLPYLPELWIRNSDMVLLEQFFIGKEHGVRSGIVTKEDVEAYKYAFTGKGGFTCPINYYRASNRSNYSRQGTSKIERPTLLVWGDRDAALNSEMAPLSAKFVSNLTIKYVAGASHWVQMDQPEVVNEHVRQFLKKE